MMTVRVGGNENRRGTSYPKSEEVGGEKEFKRTGDLLIAV
jgi:hypothetical protein